MDQPRSISGSRPVDRLRLISLFNKTEPTKKPRRKKANKKEEPKKRRKTAKPKTTKGKKRIVKRQRKAKK